MKKIWVIAQREFLVTVTRRAYILTVLGMPLLFGGIFALSFLTRGTVEKAFGASEPVAVIDRAGLLDFTLLQKIPKETPKEREADPFKEPNVRKAPAMIPYQDLDRALEEIKAGRLSAVFLIERDYFATGKIVAYSPEKGMFSDLAPPDRGRLFDLIRISLIKDQVDSQTRDRILSPGSLLQKKVSKQGQVQSAGDPLQKAGRFFGPFSMFLLLTISIFLSSGYLLQGIAEEKQNRVIEVILSSVRPTQLLTGKILGLGAAGLLQVVLYVGLLFVPAVTVFTLFKVSLTSLLFSLVYYVLGYLLFAGLMAGTGILGNSPQESGQLSALWTLTSMIPMFMLAPISEAPDSWLARGLSYFPLTAPVTMLLRLSVSQVPAIDVVISIVLLVAGIYFSIKGAAKVFRAGSLMYGKRPSLPEIWRWLREA